jgi:hypothetical protein
MKVSFINNRNGRTGRKPNDRPIDNMNDAWLYREHITTRVEQDAFSIHKHVLFSSLSIHVFYNENVEFIDEKIQKQVSWSNKQRNPRSQNYSVLYNNDVRLVICSHMEITNMTASFL